MKRHLMVLIILLFVATSSWGAGFTGLDRIWMQDATLNGSANQYWGTVNAFLEAQELDSAGNAVHSTLNLTGASALSLGTAGTSAGNVNFKSTVASRWMDLRAGAISTNYIWTLPLVASGGANYLVNVDFDGTMGYTDPASLGGSSPLTTKGDLWGYSTVDARLAVGANGTLLCADSTKATGIDWCATITNVDFVAGTDTNNTLGAITRTATNVRMGVTGSMVTLANTASPTFTGTVGAAAITATGIINGLQQITLDTAATASPTCDGEWRYNDDNDVIDYTLPGAAAGLVCCFASNFAAVVTVDVADGVDTIILDGTTLTAGYAIDSAGAADDFACLQGLDATRWKVLGKSGTWVVGGAD